jgi:hypothetical protein
MEAGEFLMQKLKKIIQQDNTIKLLVALSLVVFAVVFRLLPHPANFAPIAAIAIFGGAILPKKWALSLPLTAMVASDLLIGLHSLVWVTWGSFLIIALVSSRFLRKVSPAKIFGASLSASVFFFVFTNFAVWAEGLLYPRTTQGLINCYYNALPFFRNTLMGDLVFCGALFGAYALVYRYALKGRGSLKIVASNS